MIPVETVRRKQALSETQRQVSFFNLSVREILEGYEKHLFSPVDLARSCIAQTEKFEDKCKAWVVFSPEKLLEQAREVESWIMGGHSPRLLEGIPVGVKDIFNTADFPTQMGSPIWKDFTPGNDARAVFHMKRAGGTIPGKTVTAEFAVHTLGETLNPHDPARTPGTSSSGSAVAIATGMVPVSLGTQTAGSIVRPASFCGIYGCKPSFGLIPRTGMLKTTDSLDTIGFFALHAEDLERVFDVMRVHGRNYPISHAALNDPIRQNKPPNRPWRVALMRTHVWNHAQSYAQKALLDWGKKISQAHDIDVVEAELPKGMERAHEIHATIYDCTLAYYFKEEFKHTQLVSPIMNEIIKHGNTVSVSEYQHALREQEEMAHSMDDFLQSYDILISLSTAGEAPLREEVESPDPALIWTMTHLPVISAPVFVSPTGLPFGLQLAARRYNDPLLFKFLYDLRSRELLPEGPLPRVKV